MLKEELQTIREAIQNEVEGYEFYKLAAEQSGSEESEKAFMLLAEEELKHANYLKELFDKIKKGDDDFQLAFVEEVPSPDIYNWDKVDGRFTGKAMAVFGIAIQLEKASIDFYQKAMENTKVEQAKELYKTLIKWEKVHLDQFTKEYEKYKEEWWADQSFAPF
ncbi:Rubrerythrin [Anaerobranca californiensis DSM 14826]|jgi:rubrerythrin|uniref:Rubrerythrin n=1 Tax=Anaerobranca californiensis DSM 14826 TaxID=1120989 RepID=A0A1M6R8H5_9FIRM|nr:ferritin family protein [Anaerobranca californiensis]SHK28740.1 Rubrerythrin [Anaerobranca californiensis DSM 14826]